MQEDWKYIEFIMEDDSTLGIDSSLKSFPEVLVLYPTQHVEEQRVGFTPLLFPTGILKITHTQ